MTVDTPANKKDALYNKGLAQIRGQAAQAVRQRPQKSREQRNKDKEDYKAKMQARLNKTAGDQKTEKDKVIVNPTMKQLVPHMNIKKGKNTEIMFNRNMRLSVNVSDKSKFEKDSWKIDH